MTDDGTPSAARRPRADAVRSRAALITAARTAFERGDADLAYDDFARLAGVGVGTLYRHFPTRDDLAAAVYREEVESLVAEARALRTRMPPAEALAALLFGLLDRISAHPGLVRALAAASTGGSREFVTGAERLEEAVAELIAAGVADGGLRADVGAGAVMTALHGIGSARDREHWADDARGAVVLLVDGLRASAP